MIEKRKDRKGRRKSRRNVGKERKREGQIKAALILIITISREKDCQRRMKKEKEGGENHDNERKETSNISS